MIKIFDVDNHLVEEGQKVRIVSDIPTTNGMIYKDSIMKVSKIIENKKIRVVDNLGKIWYIKSSDISVKYL